MKTMEKVTAKKQEDKRTGTPSEILGGLLVWLRENRNLALWSSIGNCDDPKIVSLEAEVKTGVLVDGTFKTAEKQKKYAFLVQAPESEIDFLNSHKGIIEEGLYEVSSREFEFKVKLQLFTKEEQKIKKMEEFFGDKFKIIK